MFMNQIINVSYKITKTDEDNNYTRELLSSGLGYIVSESDDQEIKLHISNMKIGESYIYNKQVSTSDNWHEAYKAIQSIVKEIK